MKLEDLLSETGLNYFYIMHLSYNGDEKERLWNYAKEKNLIGLDYPRVVKGRWDSERDKVMEKLPPTWIKQFDMFCNEMKKEDIVVVLDGWHHILGVAKIDDEDYDFNECLTRVFFNHTRKVQWIVKYDYECREAAPSPIVGFNNTLYKVKSGTNRWSILTNLNI